ncbi:GAF domain-containing sensor histidine kinase [Nocardioides sp. SOB77]|uniref:Oxygen sensor histidine kinase NreB n=1 Tax=Nocardioides oceani TaxID=3058369 RepID=A0ABT8FAE7_9ACTN|nr:GAF domain-containing sensor histidine kinase [Nocardioides oceani]MDN4171440.1 GAF domain-containing sensor histidine kinase [Nocardioides oceani]
MDQAEARATGARPTSAPATPAPATPAPATPAPATPAPATPAPATPAPATSARTTLDVPVLALPLLCAAGAGLAVWLESRLPARIPGDGLAPGAGWSTGLTGLVLAALAAVVLSHDRRQGLGWALAWSGVFWTLDGIAEAWFRTGLASDEPLPLMTFTAWFLLRFTSLLPVTVAVVALLFPTGRFLPDRWGTAGKVALGVMLLGSLAYVVAPSDGFDDVGRLPVGVDPDPTTLPLGTTAGPLLAAAGAASLVALLVPVATVVVRHRRAIGLERDRVRWLLWGVVAVVLLVLATVLLDVGAAEPYVFLVVVCLLPAAMTVAVVAPRVVDVDALLGRTLAYGGLWTALLAVDLLTVAALTRALGDALAQREVVGVVLLLTVLLYGPLRLRLQALARRLVLGRREDPYDLVAGLASTLETADEGPEQLAAVAEAVAEAFGVRYVGVEVDRPGGERLEAVHGERPQETRTLPITYRGAEVGRLVLPARGLRSRLTRRDEQLLGDLVRQAATAARTSRLAEELQESRERLVVAREEERRRIRRDLHDGLGPSLSGVVFRLESARLRVERDPQGAREEIAATSALVQDVVGDVRRLVHDLRPPALDDLGLVGALRQQADRAAVPTEVRTEPADGLGPLPAAAEVAAYRVAGEALTNVVRHARASRCVVRLVRTDRALVVEVADDGVGVPADAQAGVGLVSLRERAAELGGTAEVTCPPGGGTVVRATLPLRSTR